MMNWELVVLDMAGTTVRDSGVVSAAIHQAVTEIAPSRTLRDEEILRLRGGAKARMFEELVPGRGAEVLAVFNASLHQLLLEGHIEEVPGAKDVIQSLQRKGISVCLTTGFDRSLADGILESLGWTDLPNLTLTAQEVGRGRPSPDLVLAAALHCRVNAMNRVVVCGDTVNDLHAGANAGAGLVVGVLSGAHDRSLLETAPHHFIIDSVAELPHVLASASPPSAIDQVTG